MSFGTQLQALRRRCGITQEELARQLNVSRQAVSKWESSRGYPEMDKVIYICNCYGVTMDELFADEICLPAAPAQQTQTPPPDSLPLKQSLANFFTNLPPRDQWMFGTAATSLLLGLTALFFLLCTTVAKGGSDNMTMKITWLVLLLLFGAGEALTVGLTSVWFAVGALGGLIGAMAGVNVWVQIGAFLLLSGVSMALVRPLAKKFLTPGYSATNADRVIGQEAVVTQQIDNLQGQGQVSIAGQSWTARSELDEVIPAGVTVIVLRIEGVKVFVTRKQV